MKPYNYFRDAKRFFKEQGALIVESISPSTVKEMRKIYQMGEKAVKFILPPQCNFATLADIPVDSLEDIKLPFERFLLECQMFTTSVIVLVDRTDGELRVYSIIYYPITKSWEINPFCWKASSIQKPESGGTGIKFDAEHIDDGRFVENTIRHSALSESEREDEVKYLIKEGEICCQIFLQFLGAMYLSNVHYDKKISDKKPWKKKKSGQKEAYPFDDYHVLEIDIVDEETGEPLEDSTGSPGRKHREHLRRGHWRHYKSGKVVWINDIVVNKGKGGGKITKDYAIG